MLITENGIGAPDVLEEDKSIHDSYRIEYLAAHINQLRLAVTDGVEVMGYCPWSAIDLVSTIRAMESGMDSSMLTGVSLI